MVHSRADLLERTVLDRFYDFSGSVLEWRGDGGLEDGAYRLKAASGDAWVSAWTPWDGGDLCAVEWEVRHQGGLFEAEYALLLDYSRASGGIRVRFCNEGRVAVDRIRPSGTDWIAQWTSCSGLYSGGWNRLAVRMDGKRISVVVAGKEVLTADLPRVTSGGVGFSVSPHGVFEFDHLALHSRTARFPATEPLAEGKPFFFESFSVGRDEWKKNIFPVRNGVLQVSSLGGRGDFDLLATSPAVNGRIDVSFALEGPGPAGFLFDGRDDGDDFSGYLMESTPDGSVSLSEISNRAERRLAEPKIAPLFFPDGWNLLNVFTTEDSIRFFMNGHDLFGAERKEGTVGLFGVRGVNGGAFSVGSLAFYTHEESSPFDTIRARAIWAEAKTLREQRALATRTDRLRELFLLAPRLPGLLDLIYREAAMAGDPETALAVSGALLAENGYGVEEEKMRIMALLLCGRRHESYGALQRFRSRHPSDPFGVENTLLLLDRTRDYERLFREYKAARAGIEPVRASGYGVAAWAYLRSYMPDRAGEILQIGSRLGPGRLDLALVEGDLLHARGDLEGAKTRYLELLQKGVYPTGKEGVRVRLALLGFEMGDYAAAAEVLGSIKESNLPEVMRARTLVRAISLYQMGVSAAEGGRIDLESGRGLADATLSDPPEPRDALILDLLGRIDAARALIDFQEGESYPVFREKTRLAFEYFRRAARLDPSFDTGSPAEGVLPDPDPGRYRFLVAAALPDDHPVGGFVEDPARWYSWYTADRRAELAEVSIGEILEPKTE